MLIHQRILKGFGMFMLTAGLPLTGLAQSKATAGLVATNAATMMAYPPAKADQLLVDEEKVTVGNTTLTCHLTPGHTKGCTTWTMDVTEEGKVYHVLFFGSTSVLSDVKLVDNPKYPNI